MTIGQALTVIQMRKMLMRGQMPHAQGKPQIGDPKMTSLSFDLCFLKKSWVRVHLFLIGVEVPFKSPLET